MLMLWKIPSRPFTEKGTMGGVWVLFVSNSNTNQRQDIGWVSVSQREFTFWTGLERTLYWQNMDFANPKICQYASKRCKFYASWR